MTVYEAYEEIRGGVSDERLMGILEEVREDGVASGYDVHFDI